MINLQALETQLVQHEGERLKVYNDSLGIPTIGVGRNLRDKGITKAESRYLLRNDVLNASGPLELFPKFNSLDSVRQQALANMSFNLGFQGLKEFKHFLDALWSNDWNLAVKEMKDSKWAHQIGNARLQDLVHMIQTGTFL